MPRARTQPETTRASAPEPPRAQPAWTFLTNHGHVLVCLARSNDPRVRDIAATVGITERAVLSILNDLESVGAITRERVGRANHYKLNPDVALRHPIESHRTVGDLVGMIAGPGAAPKPRPRPRAKPRESPGA